MKAAGKETEEKKKWVSFNTNPNGKDGRREQNYAREGTNDNPGYWEEKRVKETTVFVMVFAKKTKP